MGGKIMDPLQIAARFTAFVCYLNGDAGQSCSPKEAGRLARENWKRFWPFVDQDVARLLTAVPQSVDRRLGNSTSAMKRPRARIV
jgi:hypothetical protein